MHFKQNEGNVEHEAKSEENDNVLRAEQNERVAFVGKSQNVHDFHWENYEVFQEGVLRGPKFKPKQTSHIDQIVVGDQRKENVRQSQVFIREILFLAVLNETADDVQNVNDGDQAQRVNFNVTFN